MSTAPAPLAAAAPVEQVSWAGFVSLLKTIGKDFEKGLSVAIQYLPAASSLAAILFPPAVAPLAAAGATADLLQKVVLNAEQQYAAMGKQDGTGTQKAADVLAVAQTAVTALLNDPQVKAELAKVHIEVNTAYIQNLITAVVAVLNVQPAPVTTAA